MLLTSYEISNIFSRFYFLAFYRLNVDLTLQQRKELQERIAELTDGDVEKSWEGRKWTGMSFDRVVKAFDEDYTVLLRLPHQAPKLPQLAHCLALPPPINPEGHPVSDATASKLSRVRKATLPRSHTALDAFKTTSRMPNASTLKTGATGSAAAEQEYIFQPPPQYEITELQEASDAHWEPEGDTHETCWKRPMPIDSHSIYMIDTLTCPALEILAQRAKDLPGQPCSPCKVTRVRYGRGRTAEEQLRNIELTVVHWKPALDNGWFKFTEATLPKLREVFNPGHTWRPHLLYVNSAAYRCPDDAVGAIVGVIAQYKSQGRDGGSSGDTSVRFFRQNTTNKKSETVARLRWPIAMVMPKDVGVHSLGGPVLLLVAPIRKDGQLPWEFCLYPLRIEKSQSYSKILEAR
ncbi:uncharacterized protein B0I36DRAFT_432420 [Microdochium trichocladiopsis]|uniref:Uncharacterized protein n=1 Tax=Microdochium trichocladiopsis TaxID=1682393 RepID=A0A9P8Y7V5_9PEZI|nr:uncharacterized protein B0I36DRAFT_432420 [Microdochium trichocladiopsis]KAH7029781.1 hypothetical protein B0I36DRAFT_432420 [Microdochium trichocladiopsis]